MDQWPFSRSRRQTANPDSSELGFIRGFPGLQRRPDSRPLRLQRFPAGKRRTLSERWRRYVPVNRGRSHSPLQLVLYGRRRGGFRSGRSLRFFGGRHAESGSGVAFDSKSQFGNWAAAPATGSNLGLSPKTAQYSLSFPRRRNLDGDRSRRRIGSYRVVLECPLSRCRLGRLRRRFDR